jgi:hypothetical protein
MVLSYAWQTVLSLIVHEMQFNTPPFSANL